MRNLMKNNILCALMIIVLVLLTSCSGYGFDILEVSTVPPQGTPNTDDEIIDSGPVYGGTLTIASTKCDTLNPLMTKNYFAKDALELVFESLIRLDSSMQPVNLLCESYECTPDSKTWTYKIKKNVKWHDGTAFTSNDVVNTVKLIQNAPSSLYYYCVQGISNVSAPDEETIVIEYSTSNSFSAENMIFPILPAARYASGIGDLASETNNTPVGTGPYKFASLTQEALVLKSNENWHGSHSAYIAEVQIKFYETVEKAILSDCDIINVKAKDYLDIYGKIGFKTKKYISSEYEMIALNNNDLILRDPTVRKALAIASNKYNAVKDIVSDTGVARDIPVYPESWLSPTNETNYLPEANRAANLLKSTGWSYENNEWTKELEGKKRKLEFECLVNKNDLTRVKIAERISSEFAKMNIKMNVVKEDAEVIQTKVSAGEYQAALVGANVTLMSSLADFYKTGAGLNISKYSDSEVDKYLQQLYSIQDTEQRKSIFQNIKNEIINDTPFIGLYFKTDFIFYNKDIRGVLDNKPINLNKYGNIAEWYFPGSGNGAI